MYICWFVTCKCNLSCPYCFSLKDYGEVSIETAISVGSTLAASGVKIAVLTGGEPFILPYLFDLIDVLYPRLTMSVTTNGLLMPPNFASRLQGKISYITISIDAMQSKVVRKLKGGDHELDRALWAVREIVNAGIQLKVNTLVSNLNIDTLSEVGEFLQSLSVQGTTIIWKLIQVHKNKNVRTDISYLLVSAEQYRSSVNQMREQFPNLRVISCDSSTFDKCYILISPTGEVILPVRKYTAIGNILSSPLQQLVSKIELRANNTLVHSLYSFLKGVHSDDLQ